MTDYRIWIQDGEDGDLKLAPEEPERLSALIKYINDLCPYYDDFLDLMVGAGMADNVVGRLMIGFREGFIELFMESWEWQVLLLQAHRDDPKKDFRPRITLDEIATECIEDIGWLEVEERPIKMNELRQQFAYALQKIDDTISRMQPDGTLSTAAPTSPTHSRS